MIISRKFAAGILAVLMFMAILPAERAATFGFGDVGDRIASFADTVGNWFLGILNGFGQKPETDNRVVLPAEENRAGPKILPDEISQGDEQAIVNEFNPETISVEGCKKEGEIVDAVIGQKCCAGTQALGVRKINIDVNEIDVNKISEKSAVTLIKTGGSCNDEVSGYICAKCGDGICGKGENRCNCGVDCGPTGKTGNINGKSGAECIFDQPNLACCQGRVCRRLPFEYKNNANSAELMFCDTYCRPVAELIDAWGSCGFLCRQKEMGEVTDCVSGIGKTIIDSDSGYACCCEKGTCAGEGESLLYSEGQECCDGLERINVDDDMGISYACIKEGSQKEGQICQFDDDCLHGLECESFSFGQATCVDIANQKEGAACDFDDDCASGYVCISNLADDYHKCAKLMAQVEGAKCVFDDDCAAGYYCDDNNECAKDIPCAGEGIAVDHWNDQACCSGLGMTLNYQFKGESFTLGDNAYVCTKCGDGICGKGENKFNCKDCGSGAPVSYQTPYLGDVVLTAGQCQQIVCVGHSETINSAYKCNGKLIANITCTGDQSGSFGTGSGDGVGVERVCCGN